MRVIREVEEGEELFLKYKDYDPTKNDVQLTHEILESKGFVGTWTVGYSMGQIRVHVYEEDERLDIFIVETNDTVTRVRTEEALDKIIESCSK